MPSEHVQIRVSSLVPRVLLWCWGQDSPCSLFQDSQCLCGGNEGAFFSPRWCGEGGSRGVRGKFPFAGASPLYLRTSQQGWGVRGEPLSVLFHQAGPGSGSQAPLSISCGLPQPEEARAGFGSQTPCLRGARRRAAGRLWQTHVLQLPLCSSVPACWVLQMAATGLSVQETPQSTRDRTAAAAIPEQDAQPLHEGEREERESD